ncbi:MAG: hypothetical protein K2L77_07450, partial [Muribaculaceae bacterium]|nr:hypothetical protein [Muribaculaceae bacterium]
MKIINKLMAIAITLLAMVAVSACSSDDGPKDPYKGKIDSNFMSALARGEESIILRAVSNYNLHKKNTDADWEEALYVG